MNIPKVAQQIITAMELEKRITGYLAMGGLFNPEMANHDRVRDLLFDCREYISSQACSQQDFERILADAVAPLVDTLESLKLTNQHDAPKGYPCSAYCPACKIDAALAGATTEGIRDNEGRSLKDIAEWEQASRDTPDPIMVKGISHETD